MGKRKMAEERAGSSQREMKNAYFYHSCSAFKYFQKQDLMLFEFYLASFEHLMSAYSPSNWKPFDSGCAMGHANLLLNRQE